MSADGSACVCCTTYTYARVSGSAPVGGFITDLSEKTRLTNARVFIIIIIVVRRYYNTHVSAPRFLFSRPREKDPCAHAPRGLGQLDAAVFGRNAI